MSEKMKTWAFESLTKEDSFKIQEIYSYIQDMNEVIKKQRNLINEQNELIECLSKNLGE